MVHSWKQGKLRGRGSIDEISNENAHSVKLTSRRLGLAGVVDSEEKVGIGEKGWIIITSPQDPEECSWEDSCLFLSKLSLPRVSGGKLATSKAVVFLPLEGVSCA